MYSYIKGKLVNKNYDGIVIDNNGIGYYILIQSEELNNIEIDSEIKVYTYYNVTQDNISLFGFLNLEDKSMFEKLISVSKIGAKTAIGILGAISSKELALAIISDDVNTLGKLPGIGKKTAQRIILEIKDKIDTKEALLMTNTNNSLKDTPLFKEDTSKLQDVIEALTILGYNNRQITDVITKLDSTKDTEQLIKDALKFMM